MRRLLLPLLALLSLAGTAAAVGISVGHEVLPPGMGQSACLDRAADAIASQGLRQLNRDNRAVFAENRGSNQVYSLYCIADRGVVTVIGAADRFEQVEGTVTALRTFLRSSGVVAK
jgi:hypothetical protein